MTQASKRANRLSRGDDAVDENEQDELDGEFTDEEIGATFDVLPNT